LTQAIDKAVTESIVPSRHVTGFTVTTMIWLTVTKYLYHK